MIRKLKPAHTEYARKINYDYTSFFNGGMKKLIINGKSVPSKKNNKQVFWKNGKAIVTSSERYKLWNESAIGQLVVQKQGFYTTKCNMVLVFYNGDNRKRDADNGVNSVFDTLKNAGIIEDDNRFVILNHMVLSKEDKANPRVEIYIFSPDEPVESELFKFYF